MATYVTLVNWTDQGIKTVKDTVQRAQQFRAECERRGVKLTSTYWTQGRYDLVVIAETDDDQAIMAVLLLLGGQGNARTETLRAFTDTEMEAILRKL